MLVQTAESTPVHLGILTSFQLRLREALRWVSAILGNHTLCAHLACVGSHVDAAFPFVSTLHIIRAWKRTCQYTGMV